MGKTRKLFSECGIADTEILKLLMFGAIAISSIYLVGGWIYGVKEARLERDRALRERSSEGWLISESHDVDTRDFTLEFHR